MTKAVVFLAPARKALLRHRAMAPRIIAKIEAYAADPAPLMNNVKTLKGGGKRLRIGDFRVIFEETETQVIVTGLGPRGGVYD